jgi:drug/metabolite transporter (DMT)-like permease
LAVSDLAIRPGTRYTTAFTGSVVLAIVHLLIFGPLALWFSAEIDLSGYGSLWFLASGVMDPALGPLFFFLGVARVGVARGATIIACYPFFSIIGAMILLGERPSGWLWVGTLAIVVGVGLLAYERRPKVAGKTGFAFLIFAAFFLGMAHPLRKLGLAVIPSSVVGLAIAPLGALGALLLAAPWLPTGSRFNPNPKGLTYYLLHSVGNGLALYLILEALRVGSVSVVVPLTRTYPLLLLWLAWVFLREKEPITRKLLVGAALIVTGAVVISALH